MSWCHHYLFTVGLMKKATMSAATFLTLEPSSTVMANNIKYYRSTQDIPGEDLTARKVCKDKTSSGLARNVHIKLQDLLLNLMQCLKTNYQVPQAYY